MSSVNSENESFLLQSPTPEPLVMKYGGTSVASPTKLMAIASSVLARQRSEPRIIVVVSAMAGETNRLLALAGAVASQPDPKELDALLSTGEQVSASLLAMAIKSLGGKARSFNGSQIGIVTDSTFGNAKIKSVFGTGLGESLRNGEIPVITGFQGINSYGDVTTLGRGGSDTTAVAIAAHLKASLCEIYTDVDGVFSADPNVCADARVMPLVSFDEMESLASLGAKVLHDRSVTLAQRHQVALRVRSSTSSAIGTLVCRQTIDSLSMLDGLGDFEGSSVKSIAIDRNIVNICLQNDDYSLASPPILSEFIDANINVISASSKSIILRRADLGLARDLLDDLNADLDIEAVIDDSVALLSIIGSGLSNQSSVLKTAHTRLRQVGINTTEIISSDVRISFLIHESTANVALQQLHSLFFEQMKEGHRHEDS